MKRKYIYLFATTLLISSVAFFFTQNVGSKDENINIENCKLSDLNTSTKCYATYFINELNVKSEREVINEIDGLNKVGTISGKCHQISHLFGRELYNKYKENAIINNIDICSQGVMHGILEGAGQSGSLENVKIVAYKICNDAGQEAGCYHGMGHALGMSGITLKDTGEVCDWFYTEKGISFESSSQCLSGFIMQNYIDNKIIESSVEFENQCNYIKGKMRDFCILQYLRSNIEQYASRINSEPNIENSIDESLSKMMRICERLVNFENFLCDKTIGMTAADTSVDDISGRSASKILNKYCRDGDATYPCLQGYTNIIYSLKGTDSDRWAENVCKQIKIKNRNFCNSASIFSRKLMG